MDNTIRSAAKGCLLGRTGMGDGCTDCAKCGWNPTVSARRKASRRRNESERLELRINALKALFDYQKGSDAEEIKRLSADVTRLEAENRAKEQYIAEHMGGTAERNARMKRDAERLRGTTAHANSDDGILIEEEYK